MSRVSCVFSTVLIESLFFLCRSSLCLGLTLWTTSMLPQHPGSPKASNQTNSPADGESKHKNKPGFGALGSTRSSPFVTTFEANYDKGVRHSERRDHFRQLCEYKVQYGHCLVPRQYSANTRLDTWVRYQRARYRKSTEENSTCMIAEHIQALEGIGFDWGISMTDLVSIWSVQFQQLCEFKTVLCQSSILPTPSSGIGFWLSTGTTDYTRKESQIP
jgi:hypothetical protein